MSYKKVQIYAQSLFEMDPSKDLTPQLESLARIFSQKEVLEFFLSPAIPHKAQRQVLSQAMEFCSPVIKNFFFILMDNKTFPLLPQIVSVYRDLQDEKNGIIRGFLFSAHPVPLENQQKIKEVLGRFFNKKLDLKLKEDKSLIGGFRVQAGGFIFDSTVKHHLNRFNWKG